MPKRLDLWAEMKGRVKTCGPMGGTGWRLTSVLICKMSKREGKLPDKELKDNVCCLDYGMLTDTDTTGGLWDIKYAVLSESSQSSSMKAQ